MTLDDLPKRKHGMRRHGAGARAEYHWGRPAERRSSLPWQIRSLPRGEANAARGPIVTLAAAGPLSEGELKTAFSRN